MKSALLALSIALLFTTGFAQDSNLPDLLRPDANSVAVAEQEGFEVFKLLPRGTFESVSYKDDDNPVGIRGGGAYYSFTNRVHSYNRVPQIEYQNGHLSVGFYGGNYGFIQDLSAGSLAGISLEAGMPKFLVYYKPPIIFDEIRKESRLSGRYETENGVFFDRVPAVVGHVYALRAISFDEADILVAFQIMHKQNDGALTIAWKRIKEFDVPKIRYQTDVELLAKVEPVLSNPRYKDVAAAVKDDQVTLTGWVAPKDIGLLLREIREKAGPRAMIHNRLVTR
jgi:hypothetical protein